MAFPTYILVSLMFLSQNIKPGISQFSVVPLSLAILHISLVLIGNENMKIKNSIINQISFLLLLSSIPTGLIYALITDTKSAQVMFTIIILFSSMTFFRAASKTEVLKFLRLTKNIIFIVAILDLFLEIGSLKKVIFLRSIDAGIARGENNIYSEPSLSALAILCLIILFLIYEEDSKKLNQSLLTLIFCLMTSLSTVILFLPLILIARLNIPIMLVLLSVIVATISFIDLSNIRFYSALLDILSGTLDTSISSRLYYITKDLNLFLQSFYFPGLFGSYSAMQELSTLMDPPKGFIYDPLMSGSFLGHFLVELSILFIFLLINFLRKQILFWRLTYLRIIIIILGFQMIPLTFSPLIISFAALYAYKKS